MREKVTICLLMFLTALSPVSIKGHPNTCTQGTSFPTSPYDLVDTIPDKRGLLGTAGRNIAVRGDTVVVIFGTPGDASNIFHGVNAYYSIDGGHSYEKHPLSTRNVRRNYPGVVWPQNWASPLLFWQETVLEGGSYSPTALYIAWDTLFPTGAFKVIELPFSQDLDVWYPSVSANGDTIAVTGINALSTGISYLWVSYDRGNNWDTTTLFGQGFDVPIIMVGKDGYMAILTGKVVDEYGWRSEAPFFMESTDGGVSWTDPINLWDASGWTPYDSAYTWWYSYNFVLDNEGRPHIAIRVARGVRELGDCWSISPLSGTKGAWSDWFMVLIEGDGEGGEIATEPFIGYDPANNRLIYILRGTFPRNDQGEPDVEVKYSRDGGLNWVNYGIWGPDSIYEEMVEIPILLPSQGQSTLLHCVFLDIQNPIYVFHSGPYSIGVEEKPTSAKPRVEFPIMVRDNITLNFNLKSNVWLKLHLFDVSGRQVLGFNTMLGPNKSTINIPLKSTPSGVYFLTVKGKDLNIRRKILITR